MRPAAYTRAVTSSPNHAPSEISLGDRPLSLADLVAVARKRAAVRPGERAREAMARARAVVDRVIAAGDRGPAVYGVNTGFGALAEVRISTEEIAALQRNLVRSHSVGVGDPLPRDAVRAMMLLRAAVLARGQSGARPEVCDHLCAMLDRGIHPRIPARGSVGASGDLAPLAHIALAMMGEGRAEYEGEELPADEALGRAGLSPIAFEAKEGLTLLNGTQHMTAVGGLAVADAFDTCVAADIAGAMSLEALKGTWRAFDERVVGARPHPGQLAVGAHLRELLADSEIA